MKQKGSLDLKGSLWNIYTKKALLWHREAPLFLRVYTFRSQEYICGAFLTFNFHYMKCGQDILQKLCFCFLLKKCGVDHNNTHKY